MPDLFDNPMGLMGFEFVASHRSKDVVFYRQGDINFIVKFEPLERDQIRRGALVPEGREFPPRSLILGTPAKVVRPLTEAEVERLRQSAALYAEKGRQFATGLEQEDERLV